MSTPKDRAMRERDELAERANKLVEFMQTDAYLELEPGCRALMHAQANHMADYMTVLSRRIEDYM